MSKNNPIGDFVTILDSPISFDYAYEVAIVEFTYSVCYYEKIGELEFKSENYLDSATLVIDDRVSIHDMINILESNFNIKADFSNPNKTLTLTSINNTKMRLDRQLCENLNFSYSTDFSSKISGRIRSNRFELIDNFFIFCDCIEDQFVNNRKEKLLKIIKVEGECFEIISKEFTKPQYLPVNKTNINSIHITISDINRRKIAFYRGPLIIKLHFRKLKK